MKKTILLLYIFLCIPAPFFAQMGQQEISPEEMAARKLAITQLAINSLYVDTVNITKLTEDAINGMLSGLDPHSSYTNAEETKKLNEPLNGAFDGIGVQFNMLEDTLVVIQPVVKGPSEKVGILAGDRIISVNDTAIAGVNMNRDEIVRRLRGPKGSKVKLGIIRNGIPDPLFFVVVRDKIPINTVEATYMVTPTIGLIRLNSFGSTSHKEVNDAISSLKEQGMKDLILDLQQNGGGYLNAATEIANEFLTDNDLIVYTKGLRMPKQEFRASRNGAFTSGKIVILVDEYSASASEILAGAIQDQDRGWIVGRRTFGKGLVQRPLALPDGSMIRLTTARYYTPSGRSIQKPYTKGDKKSYNNDVVERYNRGELIHADSIHFPDSLRYFTLKEKRVVYGGGGIMPDYFVPLDTTRYNRLYRELSAKSAIVNANLKYIDKNRKKLQREYKTFLDFKQGFETPKDLTDLVLKEGSTKGVTPKDEKEEAEALIELRLIMKALIARDLWDVSEYYSIMYDKNPCVLKAIEILQKE